MQRVALVYLFASVITLWTSARGRILWIAGLLAGYYAVSRFVAVPGCDPSAWMTQHCSVAGFIDRKLMLGHLYRRDFDPEGLLSTLPAIATTLLGTLAGEFLRGAASLRKNCAASPRRSRGRGCRIRVASFLSHLQAALDEFLRPLTAGAACLLLALCWWLIEMRGWHGWSLPFLWLGSNAIVAYALSTFVGKLWSIIKLSDGLTLQTWI